MERWTWMLGKMGRKRKEFNRKTLYTGAYPHYYIMLPVWISFLISLAYVSKIKD